MVKWVFQGTLEHIYLFSDFHFNSFFDNLFDVWLCVPIV